MNNDTTTIHFQPKQVLLAGMAGGMAEIVWFTILGAVLSINIHAVASGITTSVFPVWGDSAFAVFAGIVIHLALSVFLASVYIVPLGRWSMARFGLFGQLMTGVIALSSVWAVNYLVILPIINPDFIALSTYGLSLISKVFFGITMVMTFNYLKQRN